MPRAAARAAGTALAGALPGVGPALAARLAALAIRAPSDLLLHLPLRYEDRTRLTPLNALRAGETAQVAGEVTHAEVRIRRRRALLVGLDDGAGFVTLRFFHFSRAQQEQLKPGRRLLCYGEIRPGPSGFELVHPQYRVLGEGPAQPEAALTPVYPTVAGLSQATLRRLIGTALERHLETLPELLPAALVGEPALPGLHAALTTLHRPPPDADVTALIEGRHPALRRLAFEELLAHHLAIRRRRRQREGQRAAVLRTPGRLRAALLAGLPFAPTGAQLRALAEILADLGRSVPMLRLLQGDVGAGKTLVAALAAMEAVEAGLQVALMAPTELLAEQHYRSLCHWLPPLGVDPLWLAGRHQGRIRARTLAALADGSAPLVVGTHALVQEAVRFARLGLIIVDEQHRFGVDQRLALRVKGEGGAHQPHQLIMSATPIPRSLAMTFYADLDISVLDELPPGRAPVETVAIPAERRKELVARIAAQCAGGRQAYWVCPLIEETGTLDLSAAAATAQQLESELPGVRVGLLHGRMKSREKEAVMRRFQARELDLLVATTVVEVGVDVPSASLMVIENAERLGLAQLHQLRGRVGRGATASTCVLLYRPPLSATARERLLTLRSVHDGFEIARRDLELRGAGELLGTRQTGLASLRVADFARDRDLLPALTRAARRLETQHPAQAEALVARWLGGGLGYAGV